VSVEFSADLEARMGLGCGDQLNDHRVPDTEAAGGSQATTGVGGRIADEPVAGVPAPA
jgi:hypothetical protein